MKAILLDTHAWAWTLTDDARLSARARTSINAAEQVLVSPISFFEIGQKVRLGKWPDMVAFVDQLAALLEQQGGATADLDAATCLGASMMHWAHRDPFDRILAATAARRDLPLLSADTVFDSVVTRVW